VTRAYRTNYSRALFQNVRSGFNAPDLDADDWAFIESVRERGYVSGCGLGDVQRRSEYGGAYCGYWNEEDAVEAYALQQFYEKLESSEDRIKRTKSTYFSTDDERARAEREEQKVLQAVYRARRKAAFERAARERKQELAELERTNHAYTIQLRQRELQTAEMEFDWARIERDQIIAAAGRDRRERRRALKAAERELRRTGKVLQVMKRRLDDEYANESGEGHPGYSGQNGDAAGVGGAEEDLGFTSAAANGGGAGDHRHAEGGDCGGPSGTGEDPDGQPQPRDAADNQPTVITSNQPP